MDYLDTKSKGREEPLSATKPDLHYKLNNVEQSKHGTAAGQLAWVYADTSSTPVSFTSMTLQGNQKTVALLKSCRETSARITNENLASSRYVSLDFATIHCRVFFDASIQNLSNKYSQIGSVLFLADSDNLCNHF